MSFSALLPCGILIMLSGLVLFFATRYKKLATLLAIAGLVITVGAFAVIAMILQDM